MALSGLTALKSLLKERATATTAKAYSVENPEFKYGRRARAGLLSLLVATVIFAAGAVYVNYQLDAFRASVTAYLEDRVGASLSMGPVSVDGLRGLRIDGLELSVVARNGVSAKLSAPVAFAHISLNDLAYGQITVQEVSLDGARIRVERPLDADWLDLEGIQFAGIVTPDPDNAYRIVGKNCTLEVVNVVGDTRIEISGLEIDVSRPVGAANLIATFKGEVSGDPNKRVAVKLTMASRDDFDLRAETTALSAEDVNVFLPARDQLVQEGLAWPTVWVSGRGNETFMVSAEVPFENLTVRDQPDFLEPITGVFTFHGTYSAQSHQLAITAARAESAQLSGGVEGSIGFEGLYPTFNLSMRASRLPLGEFLNRALADVLHEEGRFDFSLGQPSELMASLSGNSNKPVLTGRVLAGAGELAYTPPGTDAYSFVLKLGAIEGAWDSESETLAGSFVVTDGTVDLPEIGLKIEEVYGSVAFRNDVITASPVNASLTGNPFVGTLIYDRAKGQGEISFDGTISSLEDTALASFVHRSHISGAAHVRGTAQFTKDELLITAEVDGTQAAIDYSWWFAKPEGIEARGTVEARFRREEGEVSFQGSVASSEVYANLNLLHDEAQDPEWFLDTATASSSYMDVTAIGKCLNLPYRLTGGTASSANFQWGRDPEVAGAWRQKMDCFVGELALQPLDSGHEGVMYGASLMIEASMYKGPGPTGSIKLHAKQIAMPPFGEFVFKPLQTENAGAPDHQWNERSWTYEIAADVLNIPPWPGTEFYAKAYSNPTRSGFDSYRAAIGDGHVEGNYHLLKADNAYTTEIKWTDVPASVLIEHLNYPEVLTGTVSGAVQYAVDRDDPNTLKGGGKFEVTDGQFSADFVYTLLEGQVDDEMASLPPSLKFEYLRTDVTFDKDMVLTPNVELLADGIEIKGTGQYVRDGDMDYEIRVAISPDVAEKMPILMDNFNVQGHRLSQQDIVLTFEIDGPTFSPRGQLAELPPASVTLVSGALEVTNEAIRVIDFPRRILMDLLKLGGGIIRAPR